MGKRRRRRRRKRRRKRRMSPFRKEGRKRLRTKSKVYVSIDLCLHT